jgi:Putative restriction endonuclease
MGMVQAVIPESMIAERRRLGHDKKDEMWEGVLHMNEPGSFEHQRTEGGLVAVLYPVARRLGLEVLPEAGIFDPDVPDNKDFRTPDVIVVAPGATSRRGVEGRASLAIEVRSPGDESYEKIPFYGRVGVAELLIIDRDTKSVRRWVSDGGHLGEAAAGPASWHELSVLPVAMRDSNGTLQARIDDQVVEI